MELRYGNVNDAKMLSELGAKTFYDAFARDNTPENIASYLRESFSPEIQFRELSEPENLFLIAESESTPVGYAQLVINSRDESMKGTKSLEIRRIYASQQFIGKGVGKELMRAAIQEAKHRGCQCIRLGVWENNHKAIAFYKKSGFKEVGVQSFQLGNEIQRDLIMELSILSH